MVAGRGRFGSVVTAGCVIREIRGDLSARTKTFLERYVGSPRLRHFGLQHLSVRSAERPFAVPLL